ncbi:YhcN/YlaJ family sporulation lipoprotein [Peribacillus simplex]|uniref:YhcN/YlaJ family sporulation lipoprotein n=2 Tax=Peribacillus TaxID=2675229 RepID=A0AA90PAG7_9BACI|nr:MULTISPECIES: YhcN/YlaJ family sporulation lipoprotein [Peribacillus]MDP1416972.1 YhcN/YlaJ family sporulation lipoprotein [Peribacillus simplex]MDP1449627.1 YhcN/YlaJ family sporulation lipoprotein [Peribacillus frigoritolerans]
MNYKAIVSSAMMALVITGCSPNDNEGASENLGLNRTHQDNLDNPMNVNDTRQNVNNNNNANNNNNNDNDINDIRVSDDISNRVEALKEVNNASVIVTENNAYVGAVLKDGGGDRDISNDLKERVADTVREADPSVDQVYVSTNSDFVQRMEGYANDIENGKPVAGFAEEFRELVTRIFPSPR